MTEGKTLEEKFAEKELDMDEMEFVAGGNINEVYADAKFLTYMKIADLGKYNLNNFKGLTKPTGAQAALRAAWKKIGVICGSTNSDRNNTYRLAKTNEKITREEAWALAEEYARTH